MTFKLPKPDHRERYFRDVEDYLPESSTPYYSVSLAKQMVRDVLEQAAQEATDAIAFNGGTVQMEAHVREAIRKMIGEI